VAALPSGRVGRPGLTLVLVMGCQLMVTVTIVAVTISLPSIRTGLHLTITGLSWVPNAYLLAFGGLLLLGGRASDILGQRRAFVVGVALFTLASLGGAAANSAGGLIVALVGQGIGAALAEPASLALIAATFPEGPRRHRALGIFSTAAGFGLTFGLLLGGALSTVSWRLAILAAVPFGVVILVLVPFGVRQVEPVGGRFDLAGALTSTGGVTALVYALVRAAAKGWRDPWTVGALVAAVMLLAAVVVVESRAAQPIIPLQLLTDRRRGGSYATLLLVGTLGGTLLFCLFQFMQDVLGLSPVETGLAFLPFAFALLVTPVATLRLLTRLDARPVLLVGIGLLTAGVAWLTRLTPSSGYSGALLGPLLLLGAGQGFAITTLNLTILSRVPQGAAGAVSGLQQVMLRLGASLGLAGTVTVFGATEGEGGTKALAVHGWYAGAFGLTAVFLVCALVVAAVTLRPAG
jgi:MFS family permease